MTAMLVSKRAARVCCSYCYPEYGKSNVRKAKVRLRRTCRRRESRDWQREARDALAARG